ncbi:MAG: zinc ribbon domain-containing protein [Candidatus Choladocola sp.]|nr:zinc ribbon domain-containing protein [Candidatus Choladocola sp.]
MKCPKCGCSLPADSEFCQYCGIKLELPQLTNEAIAEEAPRQAEEGDGKQVSVIEPPPKETEESQTSSISRQNELLMKAYNSFCCDSPEGREFFNQVRGSSELREAYLEECQKNGRDRDNGIHVSFKQSYMDFMGVMHDDFSGGNPEDNIQTDIESEDTPTAPVTVPVTVSTPQAGNTQIKQNHCKKCGAIIDNSTKKCTGCGKQYFRAKTTVPMIVLTILFVASVGLNIVQFFQNKNALDTVSTQETEITNLEKKVSALNNTISTQKSTISTQKSTIKSLEGKAGYFDDICKELSFGNIGYAASNFKASESIILVDKSETNRKFTLTANWTNGGTVSVDYSGLSAFVSFDNDSWTTSTKMTIEPWREGVTAVTFSNNVDSKTFKVIIIVTG